MKCNNSPCANVVLDANKSRSQISKADAIRFVLGVGFEK